MLGELLELLHTSTSRWSTVHASVEDRTDHTRHRSRATPTDPGSPPGLPRSAGCTDVEVAVTDLVATSDGRVRARTTDADGTRLTVLAPRVGALVVERDGTAEVRPARHLTIARLTLGRQTTMLFPHTLTGRCTLRVTGDASILGRPVVLVEARPRSDDDGFPPLGQDVTRADLAVDRGTGLALRLSSFQDDAPVQEVVVTRLVLDEPVDDAAFAVDPPPSARPAAPAHSISPARAAGQVPFTLFAPVPSFDDDPWTVLVLRDRRGRGQAPSVHLFRSTGTDDRPPLRILETVESTTLPDVAAWQSVDLDGLPGHTWVGADSTDLVVHRDGTGIWISGASGPDAALALFRSLRAVPPADDLVT